MARSIDNLVDRYFVEDLSERELCDIAHGLSREEIDALHSTKGMGLVHIAAEAGFVRLVELIHEKGGDLLLQNSQGWTPLMLAVDTEASSEEPIGEEFWSVFIRRLLELSASSKRFDVSVANALGVAERSSPEALVQLQKTLDFVAEMKRLQ